MNHIIRTPVRVRHETRLRLVQVARVEPISPEMRRIIFAGVGLDGFVSAGADDHVKLFFPAPGQDQPILPTAANVKPTARDYTPRRFDPVRRELTIEFVLHGEGPAATWAGQATPGQLLGVGGPKGSFLIPDDYDTYVLAGDACALPAISRFLEEMRAGARALVLIEVADAREERHLPTAANAKIHWLHRNGGAAGTPALLEPALRGLSLPRGETHAWLAGEIETVRRLRNYLIEEEGLPRAQIRAAGYWRHGAPGAHSRLED
jgi:NADPH-dependent ferric siderophore reductase